MRKVCQTIYDAAALRPRKGVSVLFAAQLDGLAALQLD
jgi:hypothetical protein